MALKQIAGHSGTYILLKQIGSGGMGAVWSANWVGHGDVVKPVVIKILHAAVEQTEQERERFLNEARIAAQLNHAGIVGIFDVGQTNGEVFLVMEWVDGRDLRHFCKAVGQPLGFPISCYIAGEVLKALAHAHDRTIGGAPAGIIHYDIKPENIMISSSGEVKLTDFGIARFAATADGTMSRAMGTLRYMSPEQMFGRARVETDIYSAGVVFYELLHDRRYLQDVPAELFQQAVLGGQIPELGGPDIAAWAVMLVRQMLAIQADARPRAADALSVILEKAPFYQLGGQRLQELYAKSIGAKRSGVTAMLELQDFGKAQMILSSARRVPLPSNEHLGDEQHAAPDEPTAAERLNHPGDPDSPSMLRRHRGRMTPPGSVGGVDAVTDRTSTQGPPMLDASPVPVVAEPMPVIEEPTELLPPPFEEPAAYSFPARPFEPDVPARQSPELASGQALRIVDTPAERLSAAPASGPHPRSANVWLIVALGVLVAILLGVVIGMAASTSTQSAEVERQPSVAGLGSEQPSASTIEPQTESTPPQTIPGPPSTGPETAPPVATVADDPPPPVTTGTDDSTGGETDSTEELEDVENPGKPDVKPKPKPKPPSTKVLFMIAGGTPDAQISVGGRSHAYNGYFAQTSLRSGKSHEIRWRSNADKPWHTPGALKVEVLDPGTYYEVHLTATAISVKTKKEGSG